MAKRKTLSVSSVLESRRESVRSQRATLAGLEKHKDSINMALAATAAVQRLADSVWASAEYYEWDDAAHLSIHASVKVDSLKGQQMADILGAAESVQGLEANATRDYASEDYAERSFIYRGMVGKCSVRLVIDARLPVDGENCRRVQVGTEIKEVPKYEIQCA